MRTSQAARYARWAAAAAILLTVIVAGVYLRRSWQAHRVAQSAPPPVPATVQQRSAEFSFSKVEKDRTIFTLRASRATEFKQGSKSLLEDVWITIYGRRGQRSDNIHTQACDYIADRGQVVCAGQVQIDLQSAADAKRYGSNPKNPQAAAHMERVETSNLSFDKESGIARTDRDVDFRFPDGQGHAAGLTYDSRVNVLRLVRDVRVTLRLRRDPLQTTGEPAPVVVTASSLEYKHHERLVLFTSPVHVEQGGPDAAGGPAPTSGRELLAGEMAVELDPQYHVRRITARPEMPGQQIELHSTEPRGMASLTADEFIVFVNPDGWVERAQANGSVRASMTREAGSDSISAAHMDLQFLPGQNQPQQVMLNGDVTATTNRNGKLQRLETKALRLDFARKTAKSRPELDRAETLAPATIEWQVPGAAGQPPREITKLTGQHLTADFSARGLLKNVAVTNGLSVERRVPDRPVEFSSAREGTVKFDADGEWTEVDEDGGVRFREGSNAAQAEHARIDRAADLLTLTGSVDVTDGEMRLTAQSAAFNQRTADFRADGGVRTTYLKADAGSVANLAPQPAFLVADHLQGNSSGGRATYSGRARLWQGDSVIEADSIEIIRDAQRLTARGNVAAAFVQQAGTSPLPQFVSTGSQSRRPELWRIRAATVTYWGGEHRALLEGNVTAESSQASITSRSLELFFAPAGSAPGGAGGTAASVAAGKTPTGPLQIASAAATGAVVVQQGDRKGTAEKALYDAADQKFVLSGGEPTIYDGPRGTTTGRRLTFFFANDTIIVDSEEGSRTLTRHRVEK